MQSGQMEEEYKSILSVTTLWRQTSINSYTCTLAESKGFGRIGVRYWINHLFFEGANDHQFYV